MYIWLQEGYRIAMKLGILIRDIEYRNALIERMTLYDNDIFVNIVDGSANDMSGCLILTDIMPEEIGLDAARKIADRTVFLTKSDDMANDPSYNSLFKYLSTSEMLSELSLIYNKWTGSNTGRYCSSTLISACSENDAYSAEKCMSLARQIIYRKGGNVLVVGLGYINDHGCFDPEKINRFAKLMYSVSTGRERSAGSFTRNDSYGVSTLLLQQGNNPVAYLDMNELRNLIYGLALSFDTLIMDIGTCFRKENINMMNESDAVILFENGRRSTGLEEILDRDRTNRIIKIRSSGDAEEALAIDDCINLIFEGGKHAGKKSSNNDQVWR